MANTDKRYQKSETPILDDEKKHSDFKVVRELWVARQPDWQEGVQWEDLDDDVQHRYYSERREQYELQLTAKWKDLEEYHRDLIESHNHAVDALDSMMKVMYALQRPMPESIRKMACKEFEW